MIQWIISPTSADAGDAFQRHAAGAQDGPFVILLGQAGPDETPVGGLAGKYAHDLGPALHRAGEALQRLPDLQLGPAPGGDPEPRPLAAFPLRRAHDISRCPGGKTLREGKPVKHGRFFNVKARDSRRCDLAALCLSKGRANSRRRRYRRAAPSGGTRPDN